MAVNTKQVKSRIKSVKSTQKMTRAMEMVSAAKMRKAVQATEHTRLYATLAQELMGRLGDLTDPENPLLQSRPVKNVLMILVASNRGLCGSYNANLFKNVSNIVADGTVLTQGIQAEDADIRQDLAVPRIHVIGIGKKSAQFAKKHGYELVGVYDEFGETPAYEDILPVVHQAVAGFKDKSFDKVVIGYTEFQSALKQIVRVRQALPLSEKDLAEMIQTEDIASAKESYDIDSYLLEPNMDAIVEYVFPKLVEIQLFQAVLNSAASEHSARMVAMKNASENAGDMVKALTLAFNKARQAAITQEISEIVGGAAALE